MAGSKDPAIYVLRDTEFVYSAAWALDGCG